jgi:hypothetical protein
MEDHLFDTLSPREVASFSTLAVESVTLRYISPKEVFVFMASM